MGSIPIRPVMTHIKIGFTGSREGMSCRQEELFKSMLACYYNSMSEFHHGDCVGADKKSHDIVHDVRRHEEHYYSNPIWKKIVIHPPLDNKHRAYCKISKSPYGDYKHPKKEYLARDRYIVTKTDLLIACPKNFNQTRSGTWYTINYAIKQNKPVIILY